MGIAAVILGSCWRETVTEAVELSGVDGMDLEATVEQTFDNRAVRNLNRHLNQLRLRLCKLRIQPAMRARPSPVCLKTCSPSRSPAACSTQTWCDWDAQSTPT